MSSSFFIVNDTDKPIWVSIGVCHAALWGSIAGVLCVLTAGVASVATVAVAAAVIEGSLIASLLGVIPSTVTVGGLTVSGWLSVGSVTGLLAFSAGTSAFAALNRDEVKKIEIAKEKLKKILKSYTLIQPGSKYTKYGTLSLVLTAYVIYDDGKQMKRDCWTGWKHGSENLYPVKMYLQ